MVQMKLEEDLNQLKAVAMNQILSALIGKKWRQYATTLAN